MSLIVTASGEPVPNPDLLAGLKALDPQFTLRWIGGIQQWAIMYEWLPDDPRQQKVRTQQIAPSDAADVITYLAKDCTADEAYYIIINTFQRISSTAQGKHYISDMLNRVHAFNDGVRRSRKNAMEDEIKEIIGENIPGRPIIRFNQSVADATKEEQDALRVEVLGEMFVDPTPLDAPVKKRRGKANG